MPPPGAGAHRGAAPLTPGVSPGPSAGDEPRTGTHHGHTFQTRRRPSMGMRPVGRQFLRVSWRMPLPSAPSTRRWALSGRLRTACRARRQSADDPDVAFLQFAQGAGQVGHHEVRHGFCRTAGYRPATVALMPTAWSLGGDHGIRTGAIGRAGRRPGCAGRSRHPAPAAMAARQFVKRVVQRASLLNNAPHGPPRPGGGACTLGLAGGRRRFPPPHECRPRPLCRGTGACVGRGATSTCSSLMDLGATFRRTVTA